MSNLIDDELSTQYEQEVICPYCGLEFSEPQDFPDECEVECDCGETFTMTRNIEVTYSTYKKAINNQKLNLSSVCACLGAQFNEPECPCVMRRLGLPPSAERLAHQAWLNSPEGKEQQRQELEKLKAAFKRSKERRQ